MLGTGGTSIKGLCAAGLAVATVFAITGCQATKSDTGGLEQGKGGRTSPRGRLVDHVSSQMSVLARVIAAW
ncbi:hypothetical protein [Streptomyces sp. NPDC001621]|uniref:hypothetical protein n=1 Tax=Streptomyces sp. NPDC001621 TaxID=3364594 RepID=UPI00367B3E1E